MRVGKLAAFSDLSVSAPSPPHNVNQSGPRNESPVSETSPVNNTVVRDNRKQLASPPVTSSGKNPSSVVKYLSLYENITLYSTVDPD